MTPSGTLLDAFSSFGVTDANSQASWSGHSEDGKTVVLALWQDELEFIKEEKKIVYHGKALKDGADNPWRLGNRERLENLKWARDHCDGVFNIIIVIAQDPQAHVKEIAECFPSADIQMKITELDENTGEFYAENVRK